MASWLGSALKLMHRQKFPNILPHILIIGVAIDRIGFVFRFAINNKIDSEFEGIIEHTGYQLSEKWTGTLNAWVLIDLDEPDLELAINEEI